MSGAGKEEAAEGRKRRRKELRSSDGRSNIMCVRRQPARFKWETCVNMRLKKGGRGRGLRERRYIFRYGKREISEFIGTTHVKIKTRKSKQTQSEC